MYANNGTKPKEATLNKKKMIEDGGLATIWMVAAIGLAFAITESVHAPMWVAILAAPTLLAVAVVGLVGGCALGMEVLECLLSGGTFLRKQWMSLVQKLSEEMVNDTIPMVLVTLLAPPSSPRRSLGGHLREEFESNALFQNNEEPDERI